MNYYKISRMMNDALIREVRAAAVQQELPFETVSRVHDLRGLEAQIRADWNRYVGQAIVNGVKKLFKTIASHIRAVRTISELNQLDDRLLADIGLSRYQITSVAVQLAEGATETAADSAVIVATPTVGAMPATIATKAANTDEQREAA